MAHTLDETRTSIAALVEALNNGWTPEDRRRFGKANQQLREYYTWRGRLDRLSLFPLVSYPDNVNFSNDPRGFANDLKRHLSLVDQELQESQSAIPETSTPVLALETNVEPSRVLTNWPPNGSELLQQAQLRKRHSNKEAAGQCGPVGPETYRKWLPGGTTPQRKPGKANLQAVLTYINTP